MPTTNKPIVSVVIPVYNAIEYLPACLNSVAGQTIGADRLEIIVVDDGSTDGSADYLKEFAKGKANVKVICLPQNTGCPGHVRNVGIDAATGEWLYCVDADDWLGPEALERLVKHAEEWGSDVIQGRMRNINWEENHGTTAYFNGNKESIPQGNLEKDGVLTSSLSPMRLIKMDLIKENNIYFPEDSWYEDVIFMLQVLFSAKSISIANDYDYYFVRRDEGSYGGISETTSILPLKYPENIVTGIQRIFEIIEKNSENSLTYLKIIKKIFSSQLHDAFIQIDAFLKCLTEECPENGQKIRKDLWEQASRYYTPELKAILPIEDIVRYDYIQNGIYDDSEMPILHFCRPLPINTVDVIGSGVDDINVSKGRILPELDILAEDTRTRLYKSSLNSVIFCVNDIIADQDLKLFIKGCYQYPLMITEEPEITLVLENESNLLVAESVIVRKDSWGECYQGRGYWEAAFSCGELLQYSTQPLRVSVCFKYDKGQVVKISTFRGKRLGDRILSLDLPVSLAGDSKTTVMIELGDVFKNDSLTDQLTNVKQNLENTNRKLENTNRKLENTNRKLEKAQHKNEETKAKLAKVREELAEITNSKSWKLTKPLRELSGVLRRILR